MSTIEASPVRASPVQMSPVQMSPVQMSPVLTSALQATTLVASTVRTMLVDDHIVLREGLRRSLEANGVSVVAEVADGNAVLAAARQCQPDVVLMDVSLPGQDGIAATRQLKEHLPDMPVVILSMFADEDTMRAAYAAGAVGYLIKDCSTAEMVSTVTEVAHGTNRFDGHRAGCSSRTTRREGGTVLTRREVEVLQMLANGASSSDVARKLFISSKTVKNHLAHIYAKLGAASRTQAVATAVRTGIVRIG